jgi:sulfur carrier protein
MRQKIMLVLQINGTARELPPGSNVENLIASMQLNGKRYAIELNGEIVPKSAHAATPLNHGDKLEVVIAVGGG